MNFFKKIFIGPGVREEGTVPGAYQEQIRFLKGVWNDENYPSFGIERLFRLFLVLIQFIYPTLFLRSIAGYFGLISRKLIVEFYKMAKLFLLVPLMSSTWHNNSFILLIIIYLLTETVFNIFGLIFLSNVYSIAISYKRSVLLLLIDYISVTLMFSIIYLGFDLLNKSVSVLSAVYFSFVTISTLGYGDYCPKQGMGQVVVILQLIVFILFVGLFINHFLTSKDK